MGNRRAFVNDTPVTLSQLDNLTPCSSILHRQFDTFQIEQRDFQREVLDAIASQSELVNNYEHVFKKWQTKLEDAQQAKETI